MKTVKFNEMKYGDKEDYELLAKFEDKYIEGTADRIIRILKGLDNSIILIFFLTANFLAVFINFLPMLFFLKIFFTYKSYKINFLLIFRESKVSYS